MGVFLSIVFILVVFGIFLYVESQKRERERIERRRREQEAHNREQKRLEECRDVVLLFANNLGYIARKVITRGELEQLIDDGIEAHELVEKIAGRIRGIEAMVLGQHRFGEATFPVKLTEERRDRHVYIIGKSGYGKTTLLQWMILQDMWLGNGLALVVPEQEIITEKVLPFVPEHRIGDVIYFNPADVDNPIALNPLHLDEGEDIDLRADEVFTIFQRIIGHAGSPRIDEILRQTIHTLLEIPGTTLLDVPKLLDRENPHYRKRVMSELRDEQSLYFWKDVYPQFPKDAHVPIVHRLGRFIRPKVIRNVLCQADENLNFREIMDRGKIALFNLSDGILGEQNSQILGQLIVSKFQLAVLSRADIPERERRRFYLYVDEFQTFTAGANVSYEKMLSRARKYRLSLILAHQQTGQIPQNLIKEIFGNVSTMVSFAVSHDDARKIAGEFAWEQDGEIVRFKPEELLGLRVGETYCKIDLTTMKMYTTLVEEAPDWALRSRVIDQSRQLYASSGKPLLAHDGSSGQDGDSGFGDFADLDPEDVF